MATFRLDELEPNLHATAWVHASAQVIGDVVLAREVSIWPAAVLRGDYGRISVGWGSNVQDGAVLHTRGNEPTVVGADCVVGHLAHLESCVVEDVVLVGSTAVVLSGAVLRTGSMVAAGAVVTRGWRSRQDTARKACPPGSCKRLSRWRTRSGSLPRAIAETPCATVTGALNCRRRTRNSAVGNCGHLV